MAITTMRINEEKMSVQIERDIYYFATDAGINGFHKKGEKGWIVAHLLREEILKLMRLSVEELRELNVENMDNISKK